MQIPESNHYWLLNAHVPSALLVGTIPIAATEPSLELSAVHLEIKAGVITQVTRTGTLPSDSVTAIDLQGRQVWPCFVDMHTHLDKGHIWERSPNLDGTFNSALDQVRQDTERYWTAADVHRRMEFGLKCSYAHGTKAIRTHIDCGTQQPRMQSKVSLKVFADLRKAWSDRLILQAVCLVPLDYFLTPAGEQLADQMAEVDGVLGGVAFMNPDLDAQLDRVFALAQERHLPLDFHTDETNDPASMALRHVAQAAIRHQFRQQVVCGHCCSLAVQSPDVAMETIDWVRRASIGVVSLPMCNLYLQDRKPGRTPRWRGVTLLHELKQHGVPVAVASDNCRDPFYGFGDHDGLEVFTQAVRIAHLDRPYSDWSRIITTTPADLMGLSSIGRIGAGLSADLIIFKARHFSELLARSQHDRLVLRSGQAIDTTLPEYEELDE